jgi:hypothetical protein
MHTDALNGQSTDEFIHASDGTGRLSQEMDVELPP